MPDTEELSSSDSSDQQSCSTAAFREAARFLARHACLRPDFGFRILTASCSVSNYLASSLESVRLVLDLVENPPADIPNTVLKLRMLASHSFTNFLKIEHLHLLDNLGARKPSELLKFWRSAQEAKRLYSFLFLRRLPKELLIILTDDPAADARALATKADQL